MPDAVSRLVAAVALIPALVVVFAFCDWALDDFDPPGLWPRMAGAARFTGVMAGVCLLVFACVVMVGVLRTGEWGWFT